MRKQGHLIHPVDIRLARLIARAMSIPGRHGLEVLFKEFMVRGYEAVKDLPKNRCQVYHWPPGR